MFNENFIQESLNCKAVHTGLTASSEFTGFSIDSRNIKANECFVAIPGNNFDGHNFVGDCYSKGVRTFIIDKSLLKKVRKVVPDGIIFPVKDTIKALAALAASYKNSIFASTVAITGSSGKTTTRELVVRILSKKYNTFTAKKNFNNEIGLPLTMLEAPPETHILVLELGMNHRGEISALSKAAQPLVGMITNIGYAHIGNLGSLDAIAEAKAEIFNGMQKNGYIFLNRDDPYFEYLQKLSPVEVVDFGVSDLKVVQDKGFDGYQILYRNQEFHFPLAGSHNLSNLASALKIGEFYQVDYFDMIEAVSSVNPVAGRSEVLKKDITIINDCYNANPSSMKAGLELLGKIQGRKIAVLSDMLELGKLSKELHREIGQFIREQSAADLVFTYGSESKSIIDAMNGSPIEKKWFEDKEVMIQSVLNTVRAGDVILVKASRGMKLEDAVNRLKQKFQMN